MSASLLPTKSKEFRHQITTWKEFPYRGKVARVTGGGYIKHL